MEVKIQVSDVGGRQDGSLREVLWVPLGPPKT